MATQKDLKREPTFAGYVLGAISALVIFFSAVPIVMWTVQENALSKASSIFIVFMLGLVFFLAGAGILKLLKIPIFKSRADNSRMDQPK